jgi:hypothetical protein
MKHHVFALLLFVNFSLCADVARSAVEKATSIGRFSYEDSFDQNLVEIVLKNSSEVVKKNITKLLYPSNAQGCLVKRLLLLGGVSNASTTAIAKAMALRCGYDYYVIEASALLKEYRAGHQMLLSEVRPIIKQEKPIAIIITELPEVADYSGVLASTLWLLLDQCALYPDVLVIATSACDRGQLSQGVKEHFGEGIISVSLDKFAEKQIEKTAIKRTSWIGDKKMLCAAILATAYACAQIYFSVMQAEREDKKIMLMQNMVTVHQEMIQAVKNQVKQGEQLLEQFTKATEALVSMAKGKWL